MKIFRKKQRIVSILFFNLLIYTNFNKDNSKIKELSEKRNIIKDKISEFNEKKEEYNSKEFIYNLIIFCIEEQERIKEEGKKKKQYWKII